MKKNTASTLAMTAALAGLMGGTAIRLNAQTTSVSSGHAAGMMLVQDTKTKKEKHACKGMNSCKGQGADGKNDCKGKGSCRTDGKKPSAI